MKAALVPTNNYKRMYNLLKYLHEVSLKWMKVTNIKPLSCTTKLLFSNEFILCHKSYMVKVIVIHNMPQVVVPSN